EEIADMAERLARSVASSPFRAGEADVSMTACVGVALSGAGPAGAIWHDADLAMARAKELGEGRGEIHAGGDGPGGDPLAAGPLGGAGNPAGAGPDVSPAGTGVVNGASGQPHAAAR